MAALTVDFTREIGTVKPMHCVNNGPLIGRNEQTRSNLRLYKAAGIPYARNHDASFWAAYGGEHTVDVAFIFPDFSRDPEDESAVEALRKDVSEARDQLRSFEKELNQMNTDSANYDKQLRAVRVEAAKAKQSFDQLKVDYENESKAKKAELEAQRARVKALEGTVEPDLMAEYLSIKKHTTPPVSRLQYGQCSGCNTSLPSAILSKIRNGTLIECETCGRMIIQ